MPFSNDEEIMKTAGGLVEQLQAIFGKHPGFRPAHAKGKLYSGTFTPSAKVKELSIAPHFTNAETPVLVRFSNSTGIPNIPDTDPNADPRGIAIRFMIGERKHTDIIAHSVPAFPTRTGAEFLEMLQHLAAGTVGDFLGTHPKALAFVQYPKPPPASFATQQYYGVTAFKLIDSAGKATFIRYHVVPEAGVQILDEEVVKEKGANYLQEELETRLAGGPVSFKILAQIAAEDDVTDDNTVHWPDTRPVVELGSFKVDTIEADSAAKTKYIIFDPIPRVQGVEPSDDPLLEMRAALYLISGKQRRAAEA
ncbi:heme-dependent catalase [Mollisia scopiformis]|uniref:Heme-dependent catalase n=1 Tax=Mollisia scopiformis TaxID=149040 RepID=A0A194X863_MOLSC|nr:heme-dependent catalase [Mollisia scopiformis]KUJ15987.1 heme-dependent catalase [Mollisia scopiformis]